MAGCLVSAGDGSATFVDDQKKSTYTLLNADTVSAKAGEHVALKGKAIHQSSGGLAFEVREWSRTMARAYSNCFLPLALVLFFGTASAQDRPIDTARSTITIHVGKSGLLSAAGHEHIVSAPISAGTFRDTEPLRAEFKVDALKLEVQADPKVDAATQAMIQEDMERMTLESSKYPEITFRAAQIERQNDGAWRVQGQLTLHGVTKTVAFSVHRNGDAYLGHASIRQTDFGIKPINVGGGLIKVRNELDVDFRIREAAK